jgi:hypothetical protein
MQRDELKFKNIVPKFSVNYIVTCFGKNVSDVVPSQQRIWNFLGNRLVDGHARGNG